MTTPRARSGDPQTSHDAAASIDPATLSAVRQGILGLLKLWGPMTHTDLILVYRRTWGLPKQTDQGIRSRCRELVVLNLVEDSGLKDQLVTGRWSIKWAAL